LPLSAAFIAILFNPIRPIEMTAQDWQPYDWATATWFIVIAALPLLSALVGTSKAVRGLAAAAVVVAVAIGLSALARLGGSGAELNNTMNVDENLTTTDMNATDTTNGTPYPAFNVDENLTTTDISAPPSDASRDAQSADADREAEEARLAAIREQLAAGNSETALDGNMGPSDENQE
jgi:hypothetical protein